MDGGAEHVVHRCSITADMSPGRYMFPPAASAHALPGEEEEEVLSWKRLAMKLVGFFPPFYFSFWIFVLTVSVPASAVELDGTGGQRSVHPGKGKEFISVCFTPLPPHRPTTGHYSCMMAHLLPINCTPVDLRAHKTKCRALMSRRQRRAELQHLKGRIGISSHTLSHFPPVFTLDLIRLHALLCAFNLDGKNIYIHIQ